MSVDVLFSVIIPTYNYGHHILSAIESILSQNDPLCELVIVDDGSTDKTEYIVQTYVEKYPAIVRYIKKANGGTGSARNVGIQAAQGDYFIFLDADDVFLKNAFQLFRHALQKNYDVDFIAAGHASTDSSHRIQQHPFAYALSKCAQQNFIGYLRKKFSFTPGSCLFHRRIFDVIRYPECVRNAEDVSVFAQVLALFKCISIPDQVVLMYKHVDSLRHHFAYHQAAGTKIVDLVFDPAILPQTFFQFRQEYLSIRLLSLFRVAYLNKEYQAARKYYVDALRAHPQSLLKFAYLRKYLSSLWAKKSAS